MRVASIGSSLLVAVVLAACGAKTDETAATGRRETRHHGGEGDGSGEHRAEARIYAAASPTDVSAALARDFEPIRGSHVVASYGASTTLAQQLREGATPGVFVSAGVE